MDREKVMSWLEGLAEPDWRECYSDSEVQETARQAIDLIDALLKEQEAKNGEWITIWREDDPDTSTHARCSICNRISERPLGGYCKWCGAKMNQEWGVDG